MEGPAKGSSAAERAYFAPMPVWRGPGTAIVAFLLVAGSAREAHATSCDEPDLARSTSKADIVFVGSSRATTRDSADAFEFVVERVFKGDAPRGVIVLGGGIKGAMLKAGERYLVFARIEEGASEDPPRLFATLCGGTQTAAEGTAWLAQLGTGRPPSEAEPARSASAASSASDPGSSPPPTGAPAPSRGACAGCSVVHAAPTGNVALVATALLSWARRRARRRR